MVGVPWQELPSRLGAVLRSELPEVAHEITQTLGIDVPDYARPLEGAFGQGLTQGVELALGRFLELPGTSQPALRPDDRRFYLALGRGELRQGRDLQALLAAYRVGARVAFRRFAIRTQEQLGANVLIPLAESVFAYIDELSATSAEGYAQEQSLRAGEVDRRRSALLELLLSPGADRASVTASAGPAGWPVPAAVVLVVLATPTADGLMERLGPSALVGETAGTALAVVAAPATAATWVRLGRRLAGLSAAVGPARPPAQVHTTLEITRYAAGLVREGILYGDPLRVDEHLGDLVVHRDRALLDALVDRRLQPLEALGQSVRQRLSETLLAWLQFRGERQHVATELHIHPQTVAYRMRQLRELLGDDLDDPQARFELELALRGRRPPRT